MVSPVATAEVEESTPVVSSSSTSNLKEKVESLLDAQRANRWTVSGSSAAQRIAKIRRIIDWVESHRQEILQAGFDDFKKPATEVELTEIYPVLTEARHVCRHLKKWMRPKWVMPSLAMISTRSRIHYEAKGLTLILSPWNYPFNLTVVPLISAIAAGNCAILKPSEMTPAMSGVMAKLVDDLFEQNEIALLEGEVTVAQTLLAQPFDHVFFTGSPQVGKIVMEAASRHLTTVTLELGGKSPVVVDDSAHLQDAAAKVIWGKFINQGQTCIAPDYVLVQRSIYSAFKDALEETLEKFYGADSAARRQSPDLARIVNERHYRRLCKLLEESVAQGAEVAFGGETSAEEHWIEPTLLENVPEDAPAMQEEIFGPILPLVPFDDLDEALSKIRAKEKPLALYAFSTRSDAIRKILRGTSSGGACINEVALHFLHPNLPFGGINHSGHGSSHGIYGFKAFSHERAVLSHTRFSALKLMAPPYTDFVKKLVRWTVRYL